MIEMANGHQRTFSSPVMDTTSGEPDVGVSIHMKYLIYRKWKIGPRQR